MSTQVPKTQKAIQVDKPGGPEVIVARDIPVSTPKDDEVLIKIQWAGVNFSDTYFRAGKYPKPSPTPLAPMSPSFTEYIVAPASRVAALPEGVDKKDGVSWATLGTTSLMLIKEGYRPQKGDWVLIRAAAGGIGLVLTQIVKHLGGRVIGTVSSPEKAELVKQVGAELVLLTTDDAQENAKKIVETTGGGVHVVYDGVGKDTWEENFEVVRRKGTIVTFGASSGMTPEFSAFKLFTKSLKIAGLSCFSSIATPEEFKEYTDELAEIVQKGDIKFAVHKVYELTAEDVAQAQIDIARRGTTGKLLVHVSD
ncbi:hypothetical protein IAT38_000346 [Cryptococcus sp. DSM 104549]